MKITIEIDCQDNDDVFTHLSVIRQQIKQAFKMEETFTGELTDSNCYGVHRITIEDEYHKN